MGRPKSETRRLEALVGVRFLEEDKRTLQREAAEQNISLQELVRNRALGIQSRVAS
jgi:hypothetical protein